MKKTQISVTVSETFIHRVHVASFVGIQIDDILLWKDQIQCIDKCVRRKLVCFLSYNSAKACSHDFA